MDVKLNKISSNRVEIEIEIPAPQTGAYFDLAASELSKDMKVDGFRPGKVPIEIVERETGSQKLYDQAANSAIQKTLPKAILENKLEVIGQPDIVVTQIARDNPMKYKATFWTIPEIELGEYKGLKAKKKEIKVSDEEINKSLEYLQKSRAKDKKTPELSDDFAKSLGEFKSLDHLKQNIKDGLIQEKELREEERIKMELVEKVAQDSKMDIPEALIDIEIDKMINELQATVKSMGLEFEKYLEQIKKTVEDLKKEWRGQAEKRVRVGLVLKAIIKKEKIEASDKEVEEKVNEILKHYSNIKETKDVDISALKEYTKGIIRNEKVFELLEQEAKIT